MSNDSKKKKLYRNPRRKAICGVCSGIAEYLDLETWVVRIIAVCFLLFSAPLALISYFVACFILEKKPGSDVHPDGSNEKVKVKAKQSKYYKPPVNEVWRSGNTPVYLIKKTRKRFENMEERLQKMERFVTSSQFELERELKNIK